MMIYCFVILFWNLVPANMKFIDIEHWGSKREREKGIRKKGGNNEKLKHCRNTEQTYFKVKKTDKDLLFLKTCKNHGLIPKLIRFRIHNPKFYHTYTYRSWLFHLLDVEIMKQKSKLSKLENYLEVCKKRLRSSMRSFDITCLLALIDGFVDKKIGCMRWWVKSFLPTEVFWKKEKRKKRSENYFSKPASK